MIDKTRICERVAKHENKHLPGGRPFGNFESAQDHHSEFFGNDHFSADIAQ